MQQLAEHQQRGCAYQPRRSVRQRGPQHRTGPGFAQMDLGVQKSFALPRENTSLSFRKEAFNLFNHTNFGNPGVDRSSAAAFGKITSTPFPARQIQFALRLAF